MNTTPYTIKIAPRSKVALEIIPLKHRRLLLKFIEALCINPRPPGAKKIEGMMGLYSQMMESTKIIYKVEEQEVLILLIK